MTAPSDLEKSVRSPCYSGRSTYEAAQGLDAERHDNPLKSRWWVGSHCGSDALSLTFDHDGPTNRACSRSIFARPYICRFTIFSLLIWPSTWPLDHGWSMALRMASMSLATPFPNEAIRLDLASLIQGLRSDVFLVRIMVWKRSSKALATASSGMPLSILATMTASVLLKLFRLVVIMRAILRAEGMR
jgi:hypothetical protein